MDFEVCPESEVVSVELLESVQLSSVDGTHRPPTNFVIFTNIVFTNFVSTKIVSFTDVVSTCTKANFTATVFCLRLRQ